MTNSAHPVRYPRGRRGTSPSPLAGPLGQLGAAVYGAVSRALRERRRARATRVADDITVVSIGNLEVGGSGKTPMAILLIERLTEMGMRPVYVSRGYASRAETRSPVTVVRGTGTAFAVPAVDCRWVDRGSAVLAAEIGDEGAVVAMRCPDTPLVLCSVKARAVDVASGFKPTHIVVDDGFQTWGVARDFDLVMVDAAHPFGNGRMLPAGTLRESPDALVRADAVVINGARDVAPELARTLRQQSRKAELPVVALERHVSWMSEDDRNAHSPAWKVITVTAVARPEGFENAVADSFQLVEAIRYPDHYHYRASDVPQIMDRVAALAADAIAVTEKDWVKLRAYGGLPAVVIGRLEARVSDDRLIDCIRTGTAP